MTLKISFLYDGYASLNGTPDHLVPKLDPTNLLDATHGISGTEVNMFGLAWELARRGHEIWIHSKWTKERIGRFGEFEEMPGIVRFVDLSRDQSHWISANGGPDLVVAYHDGRPLEAWSGVLKIAHHQSYGLSPQEDSKNFADLYFTPTERVTRYHCERRGWKCHTIPNAWNWGKFGEWQPDPGRLIYCTSMERGFHRLVEAFPYIKQEVPEAHIVAFERGGPEAFFKMERMLRLADPTGSSIVFKASSRNNVLDMLATAACYAYPCDVPSPCEVWPMSLTDALATGVPVVLAPDDGIEHVFQGGVILTPEVKGGNWLKPFCDAVVTVLKNHQSWLYGSKSKDWAAPFTFQRQCDEFLKMVETV